MLRLIGDVHGRLGQYAAIIAKSKDIATVQVGDFGFRSQFVHGEHYFFGGNHEYYGDETFLTDAANLGDFGIRTIGDVKFFFIRGAFSIDKKYQMARGTWYPEEELSYTERERAYAEYAHHRPDIMLSHDCPTEISKLVGNPEILADFGFNPKTFSTNTQELLQRCFEIHQPKLHVFGHYHTYCDIRINGTRFICLPELSTITIDKDGSTGWLTWLD